MMEWHYMADGRMVWKKVRGINRLRHWVGKRYAGAILWLLILLYGSNKLNRPALSWSWFGRPHTADLLGCHDRNCDRVARLLSRFGIRNRDCDGTDAGGPGSIWHKA